MYKPSARTTRSARTRRVHRNKRNMVAGDGFANRLAFQSPTWSKFFGDVFDTESHIPVKDISADRLASEYSQQLENVRGAVDQMKSEGAHQEAIDVLQQIFEFRVAMPKSVIEHGMHEARLGRFKRSGLTFAEFYPHSEVSYDDIFATISDAQQDIEKKGIVGEPIEDPINLPKFLSGLAIALENGLSDSQVSAIKAIIGQVDPDAKRLESGGSEAVTAIFDQKLTPEAEGNPDSVKLLREGKPEEVIPPPADQQFAEEYKESMTRLRTIFKDPKKVEIYEIIEVLRSNPSFSVEQKQKIAEIFYDEKVDGTELNERLNVANPLGTLLWDETLAASVIPQFAYTKGFGESMRSKATYVQEEELNEMQEEAVLKSLVSSRRHQKANETRLWLYMNNLADWYGFDIENPDDVGRFNLFMDKYDLSPGERTLEWTLDVAPEGHLFEELPIMKIPSDEDVNDYYDVPLEKPIPKIEAQQNK